PFSRTTERAACGPPVSFRRLPGARNRRILGGYGSPSMNRRSAVPRLSAVAAVAALLLCAAVTSSLASSLLARYGYGRRDTGGWSRIGDFNGDGLGDFFYNVFSGDGFN